MNTACHPDLAAHLPRAVGRGLLCPHMQRHRQAVWMTAQCQSLFLGGHRVNTTYLEHNCWDMLGSLQSFSCKTQYAKNSPVRFGGAAAGFSMPMRLEHLLVSTLYIHLQGCRCNKPICNVLIPDWFPEFFGRSKDDVLLEEIHYLRQMLADSNEEKRIQVPTLSCRSGTRGFVGMSTWGSEAVWLPSLCWKVAIIRDEVAEKQRVIDELRSQTFAEVQNLRFNFMGPWCWASHCHSFIVFMMFSWCFTMFHANLSDVPDSSRGNMFSRCQGHTTGNEARRRGISIFGLFERVWVIHRCAGSVPFVFAS